MMEIDLRTLLFVTRDLGNSKLGLPFEATALTVDAQIGEIRATKYVDENESRHCCVDIFRGLSA